VYDTDLTEGLSSQELRGKYTPDQALGEILHGSGLNYRLAQNGAVEIEKAPAKVNQTEAAALPKVKVVGTAGYDSTDPNDPYNKSYATPDSFAATKTDTPIMETPVSIQVVPRSVMDDQKSTRIKDALENVSGVRAQPTLGLGNGFIIRGFRNERVYRNGLLASFALAFQPNSMPAICKASKCSKAPRPFSMAVSSRAV
ncbi:MAG: TonB-dependent receptor plug domain-containing protein, partial [Methylococcales bacterium]